ncbi:hypothetical protein QQX98_001586 [Neonectria punicea]|uniref:RRM domain-containing protein n=1 Tax=Neonectria punicea TaxID=979145 RepID=A0ABR1HMW4_9HYPO
MTMPTHNNIRSLPLPAIQSGLVVHLLNLDFNAKKTDIEQILRDHGFEGCILYWAHPTKGHRGEHMGWCRVQFVDKDTAERARSALAHASFKGRPLKIGHVTVPTVLSRPVLIKNDDGEDMLCSQEVPSPANHNNAFATKTWVYVKKGSGKDTQLQRIDRDYLAEYEAND